MSETSQEELDQTFIRLITDYQSEITSYIRSLMPKIEGAKDVMQETNIVLWEKRHQLKDINAFRAWAYKIAYFRTCTYIKKLRRGTVVYLEPDVMEQIATEYEFRSDESIHTDALTNCLEELPQEDRDFVMFHYQKHGGLNEYAKSVGSSVGRLKHSLIRIRQSLKGCIEHQMER